MIFLYIQYVCSALTNTVPLFADVVLYVFLLLLLLLSMRAGIVQSRRPRLPGGSIGHPRDTLVYARSLYKGGATLSTPYWALSSVGP